MSSFIWFDTIYLEWVSFLWFELTNLGGSVVHINGSQFRNLKLFLVVVLIRSVLHLKLMSYEHFR